MNMWFALDKSIYDSAGKVMEIVRFLHIDQKRFILLASLTGNLLYLFAIRNALHSYGELFQENLSVVVTILTVMVCMGTLVDLVGNALVLYMIDRHHNSDAAALPSFSLWETENRVSKLKRDLMFDSLGLPFALFIPGPIALLLAGSFLSDNVEYLILHYDPGHKKTLRDLAKSGWAKVVGLFAPKPTPAPQPTG